MSARRLVARFGVALAIFLIGTGLVPTVDCGNAILVDETSTTRTTTPIPDIPEGATFPDITAPFPRGLRVTTTPSWPAFCQNNVFSECFGQNNGNARQICGFTVNTPKVVVPNARSSRSGCQQNTRLLQLLQAKGDEWNSNAVRYELQIACPMFRDTQRCLDQYSSQCSEAYSDIGLSAWITQFSYICYSEGSDALVSYYNCTRYLRTPADTDNFFADCLKYASIIDFDYKTINVTDDMDDEQCQKFRAFVGCKAYQVTQKCSGTNRDMTTSRAAAQFFVAAINGAQKSATGNSTCKIASSTDIDLVILSFSNYRPKTTPRTTTHSSTSTTVTTTTTTKATTKTMAPNPAETDVASTNRARTTTKRPVKGRLTTTESESDSATTSSPSYLLCIFSIATLFFLSTQSFP